MPGGNDDDTGRRRRIVVHDFDESTDVRERRISDRINALERAHSYLFGVEGSPGRLENMEAMMRVQSVELKDQRERVEGLELFQNRIRWTVAFATAFATLVAGLIVTLVNHFTK